MSKKKEVLAVGRWGWSMGFVMATSLILPVGGYFFHQKSIENQALEDALTRTELTVDSLVRDTLAKGELYREEVEHRRKAEAKADELGVLLRAQKDSTERYRGICREQEECIFSHVFDKSLLEGLLFEARDTILWLRGQLDSTEAVVTRQYRWMDRQGARGDSLASMVRAYQDEGRDFSPVMKPSGVYTARKRILPFLLAGSILLVTFLFATRQRKSWV